MLYWLKNVTTAKINEILSIWEGTIFLNHQYSHFRHCISQPPGKKRKIRPGFLVFFLVLFQHKLYFREFYLPNHLASSQSSSWWTPQRSWKTSSCLWCTPLLRIKHYRQWECTNTQKKPLMINGHADDVIDDWLCSKPARSALRGCSGSGQLTRATRAWITWGAIVEKGLLSVAVFQGLYPLLGLSCG